MKDLNVRQESIKILEENTGNTLFELGHSNFLQDTSIKARETKAKMNIGTYSTGILRFVSQTLADQDGDFFTLNYRFKDIIALVIQELGMALVCLNFYFKHLKFILNVF